MRKSFLPLLIIGLIGAVGIYFGLTYKFPEVEAFQFYQRINQNIISCEKKSPVTLEENLDALQQSTRQLILAGQTYDGSQDLTDLFADFNSEYEVLNGYTSEVVTCINHEVEQINFNKIESTLSKLPEDLSALADEMLVLQQARTEKLVELNTELQTLSESLANFEEMFYNTKTSEAVQYFQMINGVFTTIETLHTEYMDSIKDYYAVKTKYYESIANKGVLDYVFNK